LVGDQLNLVYAFAMGFFQNRAFNFIYLHGALQSFANYGGEAFAFVYLLKAGIAAPIVLLAIGALFGSRILFRLAVLPFALRFGLRNALIFGIVLEASTYPILSQITAVNFLFFSYLALWALSSSFYWTCYHAYVTLIGDSEHRGKQASAIEFVGMVMGILAPLTTGALLTYFSPIVAFGVVGLAMACSALPILFMPHVTLDPNAVVDSQTRRKAWAIMFADGLRAGAFHFTWLIALFITLGNNFAIFGGALSLAGLAGALIGLFTGKMVDLGKGHGALQMGFLALGVAILARAFGYPLVWSAVAANALAVMVWPIYATATNARIYNLAQQSACPLRYHVVAEGGWDAGTALSCVVSACLVYLQFGFFWAILLAMVGCVLGYYVLSRTSPNR
jgi:MFS transporter, DHA1 family, inner membrane transport protein